MAPFPASLFLVPNTTDIQKPYPRPCPSPKLVSQARLLPRSADRFQYAGDLACETYTEILPSHCFVVFAMDILVRLKLDTYKQQQQQQQQQQQLAYFLLCSLWQYQSHVAY